tara:strand:+ start:81 stop:1346 length:1266 start_codon:yes stop_codon:yes gene_type:complete
MGAEKKMPEVRFKEFSDSWKSSSLNKNIEVLDGDRGHNYPSTGDLKEQGHTLFLSASNVTKRGFEFNSKQYITLEKSQSMGNGKLALNDIVLTSRGSVGHIAWYDEIVKQKVPYARINSGMLILRSNDSMCPSIVSQYLKSPIGARKIDLISFGSAQPQLTKASVSKLKITIPENKTEQSLVGNYFQKLDSLINQHQEKHDKLSNLKKAMQEKMFPKAGETVPEIRFDEFSGDWESKTLGSVASFYKGKGLPKSSIQDDGVYSCIHYGELFTKYSEVIEMVTSRTSQNDNFLSVSNDVLMPTSDVTPKGLVKPCCVKQSGVVLGGDILVIRPNDKNLIDGAFLSRFIRTREQQVLQNVTGSTVFHLYASSIENLEIAFSSIEEQKAIANYFQKLDLLISQNNQQITKIKNIKQACLDKMFV